MNVAINKFSCSRVLLFVRSTIETAMRIYTKLICHKSAFSALAVLVGRHEEAEHPAFEKLSDEVMAWGEAKRGANDLHMVQLMALSPHHLLFH